MSWPEELRRELAARSIRDPRASRIVEELEGHLADDPSSEERLGDPAVVAERFAVELRGTLTRRAAWTGFASLALAATVLAASALAVQPAARWPDLFTGRGIFVAIAGVATLVLAQTSFVCGALAVARTVFGAGDAADLRLVQRRQALALGSGAAAVVAAAAQTAALVPVMPSAVAVSTLAAATVPLAALARATGVLREAQAVTPPGASAAGLEADVPTGLRPLVARPAAVVLAAGVVVVAAAAVVGSVAEHSTSEGLTRAVLEAVAIVAGFALLGRRLGLRP